MNNLDHKIPRDGNVEIGADEPQKDTLNVNYKRDFTVDIEADIAIPPANCKSEEGKKLMEGRGIEVGNIFQLGTHYSSKMKGAVFMDQDGKDKPYYMGCYGIGVGRTMATIVEVSNDENGIIWPKSVTPYEVHLLNLGSEESVKSRADRLHEDLKKAGVSVLYDDRDESAGIKLKDADLIGIPLRLVVSSRTMSKNSVEWKERSQKDAKGVTFDALIGEIKSYYAS